MTDTPGPVWTAARTVYGRVLRALPAPQADRLRDVVARRRHLLPGSGGDPRTGVVAVPGDPAHPVVLLVARGSDADRLVDLRRHVDGCRARLVWVVDTDRPAVLAGEVVEWLPTPQVLSDHGHAPDRVTAARLARLRGRYRAREVVVVPAAGPLPDRAVIGLGPAPGTTGAHAPGARHRVRSRGGPAGRVLVATTVHPSDDPRIRHKTVRSLQAGLEVRYASPAPRPTQADDLDWRVLRGGRLVRALAAGREMCRRDVDLIAVHDPELVGIAMVAGRCRRVPVVLDVHEDLLARWARGGGGVGAGCPFVAGVVAMVLQWIGRRVHVTLAEPGYATAWPGSPPVFPNHPVADALPAPRPADPDAPVVYVGDVTAVRGALVLVRAMAQLPQPRRLVLVGRCRPPLDDQIRAAAASLGVHVHLAGWLPPEEALSLAAGAAVGVCPLMDRPNYRHSLPTKVLEYLAVGIPVVASDLPGTRAVIGDLPAVTLVPPSSPAALAEALAQALDPAVRAAAQDGAAAVRARFAWPAQEVLAHYTALLGGDG